MDILNVFANRVKTNVHNLSRLLDEIESDDAAVQEAAIAQLPEVIRNLHVLLYGETDDDDPRQKEVDKLTRKLLKPDKDLFLRIGMNMHRFGEARSQAAHILNFVIRRYQQNECADYIAERPQFFGALLDNFAGDPAAIGTILQELSSKPRLLQMLLEEGRFVHLMFDLVGSPDFSISSEAFNVLQNAMTQPRNKSLVSEYLHQTFDFFFGRLDVIIKSSDNFVMQRQFLVLLHTILVSHRPIMILYINDKENLKTQMVLLRVESPSIAQAAFDIFQIFVANPNKTEEVKSVLWKNKDKLFRFLQTFLDEKCKENEDLAQAKQNTIDRLMNMEPPVGIDMNESTDSSPMASEAAE